MNPSLIPFNKPFLAGGELQFIAEAVKSGKISGDGLFTARCQKFFEEHYGFRKTLLTTSCTDALEMAAILLNIQPGDEIIVPSYTFVSTANAFALRGARIVFADSSPENPNLDASSLEPLITARTRAIVVVHYAGLACDMDTLLALADKHRLAIVEDAAQGIDAYYRNRPLGSLGTLAAFSFHETKNISSGEGGMLVINDPQYIERAEIIREKGTNRSKFFRGEVDKYSWVDIGSSFLPSELNAAFLYGQLQHLPQIQARRISIWERYYASLAVLQEAGVKLPRVPEYATNNAHMFYLQLPDEPTRGALIAHLKARGIMSVFHYVPLHSSPYYKARHDGRKLPWAETYSETLLRLPLYYDLSEPEQDRVIASILEFFETALKNPSLSSSFAGR